MPPHLVRHMKWLPRTVMTRTGIGTMSALIKKRMMMEVGLGATAKVRTPLDSDVHICPTPMTSAPTRLT